jgi:hypothetical protein
MIQTLAGFSSLLLIAVGWVIGVRLLLLARTTRQVPELTMGLGMLLIGGISYPLAFASFRFVETLPFLSWVCVVVGATTSHLGLVSHGVFTWKVFRPDARWARAAVGASLLAAAIGFAGNYQIGPDAIQSELNAARPWTVFLMVVAMLTFGWSGAESLAYHARLRRRLALGLIEPVVVNRLLLWGIAAAANTVGCVVNGFFTLVSPLSVLDPAALVVSGSCGALGAVVMILTFLPPAGYLRFIEARHAARAA